MPLPVLGCLVTTHERRRPEDDDPHLATRGATILLPLPRVSGVEDETTDAPGYGAIHCTYIRRLLHILYTTSTDHHIQCGSAGSLRIFPAVSPSSI
jgi:hypothetical protein